MSVVQNTYHVLYYYFDLLVGHDGDAPTAYDFIR